MEQAQHDIRLPALLPREVARVHVERTAREDHRYPSAAKRVHEGIMAGEVRAGYLAPLGRESGVLAEIGVGGSVGEVDR